jgi:hypothetical protein
MEVMLARIDLLEAQLAEQLARSSRSWSQAPSRVLEEFPRSPTPGQSVISSFCVPPPISKDESLHRSRDQIPVVHNRSISVDTDSAGEGPSGWNSIDTPDSSSTCTPIISPTAANIDIDAVTDFFTIPHQPLSPHNLYQQPLHIFLILHLFPYPALYNCILYPMQ